MSPISFIYLEAKGSGCCDLCTTLLFQPRLCIGLHWKMVCCIGNYTCHHGFPIWPDQEPFRRNHCNCLQSLWGIVMFLPKRSPHWNPTFQGLRKGLEIEGSADCIRYVGQVLTVMQNVANFRSWCRWRNSCSTVKSSSIDCINFLSIWDSNCSVPKGILSSLTPLLVHSSTSPSWVVTLSWWLSHWGCILKIEDSIGLSSISTLCSYALHACEQK